MLVPPQNSYISPIGLTGIEVTRSGLLKLSDRMFRLFNFNISSNAESAWRPLPIPGAEEILIKTSLNQKDPGIPRGAALTIATSIGLPVNQNNVFYFNLVNGFQTVGIKLLAPSVHVKSAGSSKHVQSCIDQLQHVSSSYMWVNIRRDSNQLKEYLKKKIHEKVDLPPCQEGKMECWLSFSYGLYPS